MEKQMNANTCPSCGTDDFYSGLNGPNCINTGCQYFQGSIVKKEGISYLGDPSPEYPDFVFYKNAPRQALDSDYPLIVWKQHPEIMVFSHGPNPLWFAIHVEDSTFWAKGEGRNPFYSEGYSPIEAAENYYNEFGTKNPE